MQDKCGMAQKQGKVWTRAIGEIKNFAPILERCPHSGDANEFNPELEKAARVADFLELGELMCVLFATQWKL